jgi:hypothetical protein
MISLEDLIRINQDGIQGISEHPAMSKIRIGLNKTITLNPDFGWYLIRHGYGRKQEIYICWDGHADKQIRIESDEIQVAPGLPLFMMRDIIKKDIFRSFSRFTFANMITGDIVAEFNDAKDVRVAMEISDGKVYLKDAKAKHTKGSFAFAETSMPAPVIDAKDMPAVRRIARDKRIPGTIYPNCITHISDGIYNVAYFKNAKVQRRDLTEVLRLDVFAKSLEEYRSGIMKIAKLDVKSMPDSIYKVLFNQAQLCKRAEDIIAINQSVRGQR